MSRDALIVGINTYHHLPSLSAPAQDAEAIAQRLQEQGEFRVHRLPEVIQNGQPCIGWQTAIAVRELEAALVQLFKPKGKNIPQTALFYFSGHGLQKDAGIQEGYLATSDAQPQMGLYGLSLFWLRRLLQESPVRQRIILLDCCHSGEILNFLEADPGAYAGTDRLFMAASREYESAFESLESSYSVFTQALLMGLDADESPSGMVTNHALVSSVSRCLKGEIQQPLFESSGSEIILTRSSRSPRPAASTAPAVIPCPYRGLEFFDETDADYFFGREALTQQLSKKVQQQRLCIVTGSAGSGKTSLTRAGLIPQLRSLKTASGQDRWQIKILTPKTQPLKRLAAAFVDATTTELERAEQLRRAEAFLKEGSEGLTQLAQASLVSQPTRRDRATTATLAPIQEESRLLLIIDQFEELFIHGSNAQAEQERQQFLNCLKGILQQRDDRLHVLIVIRTDALGKLSRQSDWLKTVQDHLVQVPPMSYEELKATIVKPAEKAGFQCEANLIYTLMLDVVGAPADLALIQLTLRQLWDHCSPDPTTGVPHLTLNAYTEMGGIREIIQIQATQTFKQFSPYEQQIARRVFLALTQLGEGTEDSRRRILKSELVSPSFPSDRIDQVLNQLIAARLIVTDQIVLHNQYLNWSAQDRINASTALRLAQKGQGKYSRPQCQLNRLSNLAIRLERQFSQSSHDASRGVTTAHPVAAEDSTLLKTHQKVCDRNIQKAEIVDAAHEALIRHWSILRQWLQDDRENLRRQRRIERAAREWDRADPSSKSTYLLQGHRLRDAEDYLTYHAEELSALAQNYIHLSQAASHKSRRDNRIMQWTVPCSLLTALALAISQYQLNLQTQADEHYQSRLAVSRQWAAIAQTVLQEPTGDPNAALLVSRLAVEQGAPTYEAQASLRAALQQLRLQAELREHSGDVTQVAFSPDQRYLATADNQGSIRLWVAPNAVGFGDRAADEPIRILQAPSPAASDTVSPSTGVTAIAFSPNGQQLATATQGQSTIQLWSIESGQITHTLKGLRQPATEILWSANGQWIAARTDQQIQVWTLATGQPQIQLQASPPATFRSLEFSSDSTQILTARSDGVVQLWSLNPPTLPSDTTGTAALAPEPQAVSTFQHPQAVNNASFSPQGEWIATSCEDGKIRFWQRTGELVRALEQQDFSPLVTSVEQGTEPAEQLVPVKQIRFSPNGRFIASSGPNQQVWLWDIRTGQLQDRLRPPAVAVNPTSSGLNQMVFSPDSQLLITTYQPEWDSADPEIQATAQTAYLWDTHTGQIIGRLQAPDSAIADLQFSPDNTYIATAHTNRAVRLWAAQTGGELPSLVFPKQKAAWVDFRTVTVPPDPSATAISSVHSRSGLPNWLEVTTVASAGQLQQWRIPTRFHPELGFSNSSPSLLDSPISLIPSPRSPLGFWHWAQSSLRSPFSLLASTRVIAPSGQPQSPRLPDFKAAPAPNPLKWPPVPHSTEPINLLSDTPTGSRNPTLTSVAFSADEQWIAIADSAGRVTWSAPETDSPSIQAKIAPQPHRSTVLSNRSPLVRQLAFSPNGKILASASDDLIIRLWEVQTGSLLTQLEGHQATLTDLKWSADGRRLITASQDHTARIWDVASSRLVQTLRHPDAINSAAFSPDGQWVLIAGRDGIVQIAATATGERRLALMEHQGAVLDAAFSPDGQLIATASEDGTIRLWDSQSGAKQALLRPDSNEEVSMEPMSQVFFSPDGQYLAALAQSGQIFLWAATWDSLLDLARDRSLRQLTPQECDRYLQLTPESACPNLAIHSLSR